MNRKKEVPFVKIHGNGNDFIYFLANDLKEELSPEQIRFLCDRHKGIGADGILVQDEAPDFDFRMIYFNSDGQRVDFCGNGGRCISYLASEILGRKKLHFIADDGPHQAEILSDQSVALEMQKPEKIQVTGMEELLKSLQIPFENFYLVNTGVPHLVIELSEINPADFEAMDILRWSREIRYHAFFPEGINVNFTIREGNHFLQRTYERGVEAETLSCGTGSVAVALYWKNIRKVEKDVFEIHTSGGVNKIKFDKERPELIGRVTPVFRGMIALV